MGAGAAPDKGWGVHWLQVLGLRVLNLFDTYFASEALRLPERSGLGGGLAMDSAAVAAA